MLPLSSVDVKTFNECRPGELVVPQGYRFSALVAETKGRNGKDRGVILLTPGEVKWHLNQGGIKSALSLQIEWKLHVDLWDQCALRLSSILNAAGTLVGLEGQRTLMVLDGGRCCDLATYEVSKFPGNLGPQVVSFGKWEIRTKGPPGEKGEILYAFSNRK